MFFSLGEKNYIFSFIIHHHHHHWKQIFSQFLHHHKIYGCASWTLIFIIYIYRVLFCTPNRSDQWLCHLWFSFFSFWKNQICYNFFHRISFNLFFIHSFIHSSICHRQTERIELQFWLGVLFENINLFEEKAKIRAKFTCSFVFSLWFM